MARGLNSCTFIGNVGKDPQVRYSTAGVAVANFSIAINSDWTDASGEKQESTEWVNVVVWKKLAEIVGQYVKKGMKVYVAGRIQTRSYEDKTCGCKKYSSEIVASQMIMLSRVGEDDELQQEADRGAVKTTSSPAKAQTNRFDNDLPF